MYRCYILGEGRNRGMPPFSW